MPMMNGLALSTATNAENFPNEPTAARDGAALIPFEGRLGPFCLLSDGSLASFYIEGKAMDQWEDTSIAQFLCMRQSWDDGERWSAAKRVFQFPATVGAIKVTDLDLIPFVDGEGAIHIYCFNMLNWDDRFTYEQRIIELLHVFSRDGGETWEGPVRIDYGHRYTGSLNAITQLSAGRIVLPFSYLNNGNTFVCTAIVSDDNGYTWTKSRTDVLQNEDPALHLESGAMEPVTIEMSDGKVWMVIRTTTGRFFESWSLEQGTTWSSAEPTHFRSSNAPAGLVGLEKGRLLMCWNHCKGEPFANGVSYARQSLVAAVRNKNGTWQGFREIARLDPEDHEDHSVCYPWIVALDHGKFLVGFLKVHLANWKGTLGFRLVKFDLDWLQERASIAGPEDFPAQFSTTPTGTIANAEAIVLERPAEESPAAFTWNFAMAPRGSVAFDLKLRPGFRGAMVTLSETFLKPANLQEGLFRLRVEEDSRLFVQYANGRDYEHLYKTEPLPLDQWMEFEISWNCWRSWAVVHLNGKAIGTLPKLEEGDGISYLRVAALGSPGLEVSEIRSRDLSGVERIQDSGRKTRFGAGS